MLYHERNTAFEICAVYSAECEEKMSEVYVECLVKAKQSGMIKFFKVFLIVLAVICGIIMLVVPLVTLLTIAAGVGTYVLNLFSDVEFEYLYLDRELVVDKIMAKSRRKRLGTYSLDRIEIMAPVRSHRLDNYKNRKTNDSDYSIREICQPDLRYAIYYEGGEKIIISPSEEMVKAMRNNAPRKIYMD